jgi:catechol 2,3-dioxygenase-like lactoylglutathione lyase family enzyme
MALTRISLVSQNPQALAAFYQNALGFSRIENTSTLRLLYGDSEIEILAAGPAGRAMPAGLASNDLIFQHFAMLVSDIDAACEKLNAHGNFSSISTDGPVQLPASSGGAIAFKFRDSDGHPLEFLQPLTPCKPRIDHAAIVVANSQASINFYAAFGLTPHGGSLNAGPEQAVLDGLNEPIVTVTRLTGQGSPLALELLCYHQPAGAPPPPGKTSQDVWSTRLIFSTGPQPGPQQDPDGHDIFVEHSV